MKDKELDCLIVDSNEIPLLIVDFEVILHRIKDVVRQYERVYRKNYENIIKLVAAYAFNNGPKNLNCDRYKVVIIGDRYSDEYNQGYWRHKAMLEDEYMIRLWSEERKPQFGYKAGRHPKDEEYYCLKNVLKDYCEKYLNYHTFPGFEADDIAGAIYRNKEVTNQNRVKIFYTVDRDWTQLVSEENNFLWYTPRIPMSRETFQDQCAGNNDVILHAEIKMGHKINHPSELVNAKILTGDAGDNCPAGTPSKYMSLIEPNEKYSIEKLFPDEYKNLIADCLQTAPNNRVDHLSESMRLCERYRISPDF
jgi:hypothetical protein